MPDSNQRSAESAEILAYLQGRVASYADAENTGVALGAGATGVTLVSQERRPSSRIYRFRVEGGRADRMLLVKVASYQPIDERRGASDPELRPRITTIADREAVVRLEYDALSRIHAYFSDLADPRFGSVRVFDIHTHTGGIVMEAINHSSLRDVAFQAGRWPSRRRLRALVEAFEHAGAWLRAYHALPASDTMAALRAGRDDFIGFVRELTTYLQSQLGDDVFLRQVDAVSGALAESVLPRSLPTGPAHGDFAMRNIVVGQRQQVTVLDTLARYRTAIYRDIGYFLADLHASGLSALGGAAFLHGFHRGDYRRALLSGYFGGEPWPVDAVRLYEVQALLERWSAVIERRTEGRRASVIARTQKAVLSRYFRRAVAARLRIDA